MPITCSKLCNTYICHWLYVMQHWDPMGQAQTQVHPKLMHMSKDAFGLEKEPQLDHSHHIHHSRLHYYIDCVDILCLVWEKQRVTIGAMVISVFPYHTSKTARAWASFNKVLCGIPGKRFGLLYPAHLCITYDGARKSYFISSWGYGVIWDWRSKCFLYTGCTYHLISCQFIYFLVI